MFTNLKLQYQDGTIQRIPTEPMGRTMAKELMLYLFYEQSDVAGGDQIMSIRFYQPGVRKPLSIHRQVL